jgi:methionyl-tRNA synthetase
MSAACYDTKPAEDCPVCGGMYKGQSCEVCGYDGELVRDNAGKDAINRYCMYARKAVTS